MTAHLSTIQARLHPTDAFPTVSAPLAGGGTLTLPSDLAGTWSVVLFYRGHWCPYCRTQLADFQAHLDDFAGMNTRVVALSVDQESDAQTTIDRHALTFPIACGLDAQDTAERVGNELSGGHDAHGVYSNATGFVLTPDGHVALALYSTGAIGRLNAAETLGFLRYAQRQG